MVAPSRNFLEEEKLRSHAGVLFFPWYRKLLPASRQWEKRKYSCLLLEQRSSCLSAAKSPTYIAHSTSTALLTAQQKVLPLQRADYFLLLVMSKAILMWTWSVLKRRSYSSLTEIV